MITKCERKNTVNQTGSAKAVSLTAQLCVALDDRTHQCTVALFNKDKVRRVEDAEK